MSQPTQRCFCKTSSHSYAVQSLRGNLTLSNHMANFQNSVSRPMQSRIKLHSWCAFYCENLY